MAACRPTHEGIRVERALASRSQLLFLLGIMQAWSLQKGSGYLDPGERWVGARPTVAHKRISPLHKDSGPLLSLTRSTKEVTFVCLGGRRGCGTMVQAWGVGRGGGTVGGATMTEGVDEVKTQE